MRVEAGLRNRQERRRKGGGHQVVCVGKLGEKPTSPTQCSPGFIPPELASMKQGKQFYHRWLVIKLHEKHGSDRALGCRMRLTSFLFLQRAFVKNEDEEFLQKYLAGAKELSMR